MRKIIDELLDRAESSCETEREGRLVSCLRYFVERDRRIDWRLRILWAVMCIWMAVNAFVSVMYAIRFGSQ